jgi:hypothetical protein
MRKWVVLFIVAATCFPALPAATEACGWRRCRPAPCYQYQLYYPVPPCQPCYPAPLYSPAVAPTAPPTRTVTIKGKTYQILPTSDRPAHEQEELEKKDSLLLKNPGIPPADVFNGTVRRIAKVIIFNGDPKAFDSVDALRVSLRNDQDMKALNIGRGPTVNRVAEEKFNVKVPAYIYAFRKESDNDYHVIIGDKPGTLNPRYLNAEISGIPVAGSDENRNQLWAVRKAFKQAFALGDDGPDAYFRPHPPVPVRIAGSLFWDVEHFPQTVGPNDFPPKTAWEIHPISDIEFLD